MNSALIIAFHEFRSVFQHRVFQILTVAFPLVAVIGFAAIWFIQNVGGDDGDEIGEPVKYGYVDMAGVINDHLTQGRIQYVPYPTFEEGQADLLAENIRELFIIPEDYIETGLVQSFSVGSGLRLDGVDDTLTSLLLDNLIDDGTPPELVARLKRPAHAVQVSLDSDGAPNEISGGRVVFFLGLVILLFISLLVTANFMLQGLGQEKENRIMEVLLSSVTPAQLMVGKIIGLGAAGLAQITIWIVAALIFVSVLPSILPDLGIAPPGVAETLLAIMFFILGYMLFGTLLAGIGAITTTTQESQQISILVNSPLIIPIYAWSYIVENPTSWITRVLTFFPFTAPLVVFQRLGPHAIEAWEIAASLAILALAVLFAMFVVSRVFRAFLLSYGKRPSIKQLWAALRGR